MPTITAVGQIDSYRCKVVDSREKWFMTTVTISAKVDANELTRLSGQAVVIEAAPQDDEHDTPFAALARLDDHKCKVIDREDKQFVLDVAIPNADPVDANALTAIAGVPCDISIHPSQEELPFGGKPKGKGKARGKDKTAKGKKNKKQEELPVD